MGHKVNPIGLRLGINRTWDSRWFADSQYSDLLIEDLKIREYLHKRLRQAGVSKVVIERPAKKARITIHTARPGVVIGKKGQEIEALRKELAAMTTGDVHRTSSKSASPRSTRAWWPRTSPSSWSAG
jgi:small subunit ribosomal protein S3